MPLKSLKNNQGKLKGIVFMVLLCASPLHAQSTAAPGTSGGNPVSLMLKTNEQRPWTLPGSLERIAIADPEIADITRIDSSNQALLVGHNPGTTTILMWYRGNATPQRMRIEVRSPLQEQLQQSTQATLGIHHQKGLITGNAATALEHLQLRQAAASVGLEPNAIIDNSTIAHSGVVQVEVKVVEFSKSVMRQIGLNFSNTNGGFSYALTSPGSAEGGLASAFNLVANSIAHNWKTSIDLLQANGMARVLAEPTLVALSGQSASFLSGGELPIPEAQGLGSTTITFKSFGIGLTVTPTILSPDRIALKVAPEASDLDYSRGVTMEGVQIPAISTRRADTTIELGDGETFIIGGLVSSQTSSMVNKLPVLGDLPVIGAFFRNLNQKQEDRELVILVTPRLVRPIAKGQDIPLPGTQATSSPSNTWASWLLQPGPDPLPGFSR